MQGDLSPLGDLPWARDARLHEELGLMLVPDGMVRGHADKFSLVEDSKAESRGWYVGLVGAVWVALLVTAVGLVLRVEMAQMQSGQKLDRQWICLG